MTKLAFITADLARKREELEQFAISAKVLQEALEKNAAERQQLMAEVYGLTNNDYNNINDTDPKVASLEEKVAMLEAEVAELEAKEREMTMICAHASKGAASAGDKNDNDDSWMAMKVTAHGMTTHGMMTKVQTHGV